jgi:hypothetical protein
VTLGVKNEADSHRLVTIRAKKEAERHKLVTLGAKKIGKGHSMQRSQPMSEGAGIRLAPSFG